VLADIARLPAVARLLVLTQLAFNVGFYLVLPFLAGHLADDLGVGSAVIGLVLGLRAFSQQGLFLFGGMLADRFGVRPVVLLGCAVRVAGFVVLGFADALPGILAGAMLTGVAAALFSPAVESALAREGGRLEAAGRMPRTEMFAVASVFVVVAQVPIARLARDRLGARPALVAGFLVLAAAFGAVAVAASGLLAAAALWCQLRDVDPRPRLVENAVPGGSDPVGR
jgi:hypothetical protein